MCTDATIFTPTLPVVLLTTTAPHGLVTGNQVIIAQIPMTYMSDDCMRMPHLAQCHMLNPTEWYACASLIFERQQYVERAWHLPNSVHDGCQLLNIDVQRSCTFI